MAVHEGGSNFTAGPGLARSTRLIEGSPTSGPSAVTLDQVTTSTDTDVHYTMVVTFADGKSMDFVIGIPGPKQENSADEPKK